MAADTVVRAWIDGQVKEEAAQVLEQMGLSVSDAIRLLMVRIAREKALPFDVRYPTMKQSRRWKKPGAERARDIAPSPK